MKIANGKAILKCREPKKNTNHSAHKTRDTAAQPITTKMKNPIHKNGIAKIANRYFMW